MGSKIVLLAGGGTGGHLYPGVAVAAALIKLRADVKPLFLCTNRPIDATILEPTGFAFTRQPIVPPVKSVGGLLRYFKSWRETREQLRQLRRELQPAAILGLGGYAAEPAVRYFSERKVPAMMLNPDVIPGKANQFLFKKVTKICCQFEATRQHLPAAQQGKMAVTGCPIRDDLLTLPSRAEACQRLGLNPKMMTLTITGASQGAQTVNDATLASLAAIKLQGWNILHLAGKEHAEKVRAEYREAEIPAAVLDFTPAMNDVWAVTDLTVSRSGASTCAELTACGIAGILMPYPFHKDMHQRANAQVLEQAGAAVLLDDQKDRKKNSERLTPILQSLLYDATKRTTMAAAAKSLGRPDAAEAVARLLADVI